MAGFVGQVNGPSLIRWASADNDDDDGYCNRVASFSFNGDCKHFIHLVVVVVAAFKITKQQKNQKPTTTQHINETKRIVRPLG